MRELPELPVFSSRGPVFDPENWRLRVDGLAVRVLSLSLSEVKALPMVEEVGPFECVEGWRVPGNRWQGIAVATLLELSRPLPEARHVTFHAGDFIMSLPIEEAPMPRVLLAYSLNGSPLAPEHGAPLRLVAPGRECYYGLKWVEHVELTREPCESGKTIAMERLRC